VFPLPLRCRPHRPWRVFADVERDRAHGEPELGPEVDELGRDFHVLNFIGESMSRVLRVVEPLKELGLARHIREPLELRRDELLRPRGQRRQVPSTSATATRRAPPAAPGERQRR
jgi:hypothetical protein